MHIPNMSERVVALAGTGLTRREIAAQLSLTRSAICGILWRRYIATPKIVTKSKPA